MVLHAGECPYRCEVCWRDVQSVRWPQNTRGPIQVNVQTTDVQSIYLSKYMTIHKCMPLQMCICGLSNAWHGLLLSLHKV